MRDTDYCAAAENFKGWEVGAAMRISVRALLNRRQTAREAMKLIRETEVNLDKIRGCLLGGAAGDALGYAVEFWGEDQIFSKYGKKGITEYELDKKTGKALISDDTQMTLFTANGLLVRETRGMSNGVAGSPRGYVAMAYDDWLRTQEISYEESRLLLRDSRVWCCKSWLADVPELYSCRAPGNTCLSALRRHKDGQGYVGIMSKTHKIKAKAAEVL